ncbi:MAG TPA: hypothetical protein VF778_03635 [Xanthobacteraceae bacterium]
MRAQLFFAPNWSSIAKFDGEFAGTPVHLVNGAAGILERSLIAAARPRA